jgi:glycosyltransferase involved in cell wall biosynthesis
VLSVITPVYNLERYVGGCIESVLGQTLRDLELIVVDDGSTDDSAAIVAHYAARDSRVRGFRGPNRGVSHARNVAMQHARGRYFAMLDGDDKWEPAFATTLVQVLERRPEFAVVSGNALNAGGGVLDGRPVLPWPDEAREIRFVDMIEHDEAVFIMSVFRREVFDTIGGFNEALFRGEDYEFWMRAAAAGFRFITHPEPLARYSRRPGSSSSNSEAMFEGMMTVLASARGFRHRARADELGAIDRKLERIQADYLLTKGKSALLRRDYEEARSHFWELYRRGEGVTHAAVSVGLRISPGLVFRAYKARLRVLARAGTSGRACRVEPGPVFASELDAPRNLS